MTLTDVVGNARIFDLGRPLERGMPQSPNHPSFQMILERRHGDRSRADGTSSSNEIIIMGGHVGTHVDALSHFSHDGLLHGGVNAEEAQRGGRFAKHGAETLPPVVARGVLLDVLKHVGDRAGAPGYQISAADLEATAEAAGVTLKPGNAVLIRTGWGRRWANHRDFIDFENGLPGPGTEGIAWLCARNVGLVGSDTIAFEHVPAGAGLSLLPGHKMLLVDSGIPIVETLDLEELADAGIAEFLFIMTPLKLVGATASPVRPLAVAI